MVKAKDIPTGAQLLILPINTARVTAGYKNAAYLKGQGYAHYGIDYNDPVSGKKVPVWASGAGTVLAAGLDNVLGNTLVVRYPGVYIPATGKVQDLILRYCHLDSISCTKGQKVTKDTQLGVMGMTGRNATGVHLHLEVDMDTEYPLYSPTISTSSNVIKAGARGAADTTLDPSTMLVLKDTAPDNQSIIGDARWPTWWSDADVALPKWSEIYAPEPPTDDNAAKLQEALAERDAAVARAERAELAVGEIYALVSKFINS